MTTLRLILGDQLNIGHSWFATTSPDVVYVLMEIRQETDYVLHHAQKILGIFAAMRDFAKTLSEAGHRVTYLAIDAPDNAQSLPGNLDALSRQHAITRFEYQAPDEWRLDRQLADYLAQAQLEGRMVDSEHFYTTRNEAADIFAGRKQWLMEHFYRQVRNRHQVLMSGNKPLGGKWNFDQDNRKPWPGYPAEPTDHRPRHDHSALWQTIADAGVSHFGNPAADRFAWPLNRAEALQQFDAFIRDALPHFGDFQDALTYRAWRLFHSLISFALNTKMLNPPLGQDSCRLDRI